MVVEVGLFLTEGQEYVLSVRGAGVRPLLTRGVGNPRR